jgi:tripartite ATP-independent transporter DctM subunit
LSPVLLAILLIAVFLILSLNGLPVAFSFAVVGTAGLIYFRGIDAGLAILGHTPFSWGTESNLLPLPLFILMGLFAFHSRISQDLYETAHKWLGQLPGGIALATNISSTFFAACCGVSMAGAATMGSIAYPEMHKLNYSRKLATGCIAAGGGLSSLIPPSIAFIIYGFLTERSIAKLFMAGILPGIMVSLMFLMTIYIICRRNPRLGPPGPSYSWRERIVSLKGVWGFVLLFLLVMGGLYFGVFTPTEAGAMGAFGTFFIALIMRRLTFRSLIGATKDTLKTSCFIMTMIIGANIFNTFLGVSGLTSGFSQFITTIDFPRYMILIGILIIYVPLGMFLDIGAVILLTVPIFVPPLEALGFDAIWLGILITMIAEIGFITPPVGLNAFIVHGVTKVPLADVFRGVIPFVIMMLFGIVLVLIFPQIALFLPNLIG